MNDDCLICERHAPCSHVGVWNDEGQLVGRVCATHTLHDVIFWHGSANVRLRVRLSHIEVEASEAR